MLTPTAECGYITSGVDSNTCKLWTKGTPLVCSTAHAESTWNLHSVVVTEHIRSVIMTEYKNPVVVTEYIHSVITYFPPNYPHPFTSHLNLYVHPLCIFLHLNVPCYASSPYANCQLLRILFRKIKFRRFYIKRCCIRAFRTFVDNWSE